MRRLLVCAGILSAFTASPALAHDFWMSAASYRALTPGNAVDVQLLVGHAGDRVGWGASPQRVMLVEARTAAGVTNVTSQIRDDLADGDAAFTLDARRPGSTVIRFDTDEAFIELPAAKFDAYVREEGLSLIEAVRGDATAPGRELYSRNAKAILQTGNDLTDVTTPIGQILEIVPTTHPLTLGDNEPLRIAVFYKGAPAAGVSVHLESLSIDLLPEQTRVTGADGSVEFSLPKRGAWKVDAVWGEAVDHPKADFRTVFSSLTFGFE